MTRWQYRIRPTNLGWDECSWHDVGDIRVQSIRDFSELQFRRKPRRSLLVAVLGPAWDKQQRGEEGR